VVAVVARSAALLIIDGGRIWAGHGLVTLGEGSRATRLSKIRLRRPRERGQRLQKGCYNRPQRSPSPQNWNSLISTHSITRRSRKGTNVSSQSTSSAYTDGDSRDLPASQRKKYAAPAGGTVSFPRIRDRISPSRRRMQMDAGKNEPSKEASV